MSAKARTNSKMYIWLFHEVDMLFKKKTLMPKL